MLKLLSGFDVRSATPIDKRFIRSKADMRNTPTGSIPNYYFCVCSDDGEFYLYNENNEASLETGKYKKLEVTGHEPEIYYYCYNGASKEQIAADIKEIAAAIKPGDAIISTEGYIEIVDSSLYSAFPNGAWDPNGDQPLFSTENNNIYRYDVYGKENNRVTSKVKVVGDSLFLSIRIDEFFDLYSNQLGYAACDPTGKGKLIPSLKTIMITDLKPGYESLEEVIEASVPKDSLIPGKEWTLSFDTII